MRQERVPVSQVLWAKPTEGVCLTAQKSYKSEQIEQINNDEKKDLEDLERFVRFIRLSAHQLVSAQPTERVCREAHHI